MTTSDMIVAWLRAGAPGTCTPYDGGYAADAFAHAIESGEVETWIEAAVPAPEIVRPDVDLTVRLDRLRIRVPFCDRELRRRLL